MLLPFDEPQEDVAEMTEAKRHVLVFLGSPRKGGNSRTLAMQIAAGATAAGADVETLDLQAMEIVACRGCGKCRRPTATGCTIRDDMTALYSKIAAADALVFTTPVYWFTVSAQLKRLMDRFYAFGRDGYRIFNGKVGAVAISYALPDLFSSGGANVLRMFQDMFGYLKMVHAGYVCGTADEPGEMKAQPVLLKAAKDLGVKVVNGG